MKSSVDFLQPYLPKSESNSQTTLVLGTVKGDVHDVGKNLVDIILSNNGYKVVNIGIKAELAKFLEALKNSNANAIGMSGLLVKSTQVMLENLKEMDKMGINLPVLLGGAALNLRFIEDFCYPAYSGPIIYCKDAFDAISALQSIEKNEIKAGVPLVPKLAPKAIKESNEEVKFIDVCKIDSPKSPFIGRKVWHLTQDEKLQVFDWINQNLLFKERWGYKAGKMDKVEYETQLNEVVKPAYERLKKQLLEEDLFEPVVIYGYFNATKDDNALILQDENSSYRFEFPRQSETPQRCLSDYFNSQDIVPLSVVSSGLKLPEFEKKLYETGNFAEYHLVHGLSSELAEALAEMVHARIRIELGLNEDGKPKLKGYTGKRYSFGYPACPDLEQNRELFALLKPEEFGVVLSETCLIEPEASTSAIVVYHSEAEYYTT
jgi:5-methyltetrahydrofolate--homocysteine methyltransferase